MYVQINHAPRAPHGNGLRVFTDRDSEVDLWNVGLMERRTYGVSDLWGVGLMGCRTYGMSDLWGVGIIALTRSDNPGKYLVPTVRIIEARLYCVSSEARNFFNQKF